MRSSADFAVSSFSVLQGVSAIAVVAVRTTIYRITPNALRRIGKTGNSGACIQLMTSSINPCKHGASGLGDKIYSYEHVNMSTATINVMDDSIASDSVATEYLFTAFAMMICYDYVLCLGHEVELFWNKKVLGSSVIFFANRYSLLVYGLSCFLQVHLSTTSMSCKTIDLIFYIANMLLFAIAPIFGALRAYAISNGNKLIGSAVLMTGMVPTIVNLDVPTLATRSSVENGHTVDQLGSTGRTLLFMNLMELAVRSLVNVSTTSVAYTSFMAIPVSSILISHFLVNLQQLSCQDYQLGSRPETSTSHNFSDPVFNSIVGSMGADLEFTTLSASMDAPENANGEPEEAHQSTDKPAEEMSVHEA
ncbi:uncharacterized protein C8Q71DRAFT_721107 [Rhodofomes roseus]|uniref:DUF6533 domain-containing protein n=1 Tax=Rhodofomes roseus TaxID=34475 RepID=A0ABQ8KPN7_9APHY|nr:uncharacterized protein C8Q71DRAFT_721107 [Rhodofomes roseus]KAH9840577.1 hypothetical protein C8Q71DRAFT_721107 [Rhodofomes roseus]